ncbi:MAG: CopD family protein [Deltaproteobacteria bacterium]|nr:CopD family protein [Deltaproteobacteria bacterium]
MLSVALILHLLGVIVWIGGGVAGALIAMSAASRGKDLRQAVLGDVRRALLFVSAPGLVLAFAGGLVMLISGWASYRSMGWLHAKLTIGVLLAAVSGILSGRIRRAATGERDAPAGLFAALGGTLAIGALLALVLVVLRPF